MVVYFVTKIIFHNITAIYKTKILWNIIPVIKIIYIIYYIIIIYIQNKSLYLHNIYLSVFIMYI